MWATLCRLLGKEHSATQESRRAKSVATLPLRSGGLGLRSAVRIGPAALWASWADTLPMMAARGAQALQTRYSANSRKAWPAQQNAFVTQQQQRRRYSQRGTSAQAGERCTTAKDHLSQNRTQSQARYDTAGNTTQLLDEKPTTEKRWCCPDETSPAKPCSALKQVGAQESTSPYSHSPKSCSTRTRNYGYCCCGACAYHWT